MNKAEMKVLELLKGRSLNRDDIVRLTSYGKYYVYDLLRKMENEGKLINTSIGEEISYTAVNDLEDEMSRRRAAIEQFGTVPILI